MKKWIISLLIIIALCGIRFYDVWILDVLRLKALDSHQRQQQTEIVDNVVTVEINNETLKEYGQWPWPRDELANLISGLYAKNAGLVVLPILFAEPDRFGKDDYFTDFLLKTPTIIGQVPANVTEGNPVTRGVASIGGTGWEKLPL